jgi:hypothetical protein
MKNNNHIIIVRGIHPLETSAKILARKVYEDLNRRGHTTSLFTIPFRTTHFADALGSNDEYKATIELLEYAGLNPSETFYFDFHNYKIPDDFGARNPNLAMFKFTPLTSSTDFKNKYGCIGYEFQELGEYEGWCEDWYDDGLYGEDYKVINSIVYEIPAFFKRLPDNVLARCGGRYFAESSGIYNDLIVDIQKTKKAGFIDNKVIRHLSDNILRQHKKYPHPIKTHLDELL